MVIKLYKVLDDPKCVNKALTSELTVSGVARDPVNVTTPVIEVEADNNTLAGYNYAYIEDYARYYFVDITNDSWKLNILTLRCDILTSSKAWLLARMATVTRNERLYNAYLEDTNFSSYAYTNIVTKNFPLAVNMDSLVLMTVG